MHTASASCGPAGGVAPGEGPWVPAQLAAAALLPDGTARGAEAPKGAVVHLRA